MRVRDWVRNGYVRGAYLVDEGATAGVGAGDGRAPEGTAEVDGAVVVGVDVRVGVGLRARAVVGEGRVAAAAHLVEVAEHGAVARGGVRAEPGRVARRRRGVAGEVAVGAGRASAMPSPLGRVCR